MVDDETRGLGWPWWVEADAMGVDERAFSLRTVTFLLLAAAGFTW
jgi:hypothetical protein